MRITTIVILLFLLSAFAIGIELSGESEWTLIDSSLDNASRVIENITITTTAYSNSKIDMGGFYLIIEKYIKFIGTLGMETMRTGIKFGYDNPSYFTPENIINIVKLIVWLLIISLLIKPLFYLLIFIVMGVIWLKDKIIKRREIKDETKD